MATAPDYGKAKYQISGITGSMPACSKVVLEHNPTADFNPSGLVEVPISDGNPNASFTASCSLPSFGGGSVNLCATTVCNVVLYDVNGNEIARKDGVSITDGRT